MIKNFEKLHIRSTAGPLYEKIDRLLEDTLFQYPTISDYEKLRAQIEIHELVDGDITALAEKDPAARVSEDINLCKDYVAETYTSLHAVVCYRVAHYLQCVFKPQHQQALLRNYLSKHAKKISEESKEKTKIEIHPSAKIGQRFVLDHGFGTIIGETSEIGDDCCFLQGVILGARQINVENKDSKINPENKKKRHPTIEDRVTIAGNVRVWGNITIGHDSTIQAYSIVTESIPPFSIVQITNQLQVIRLDGNKIKERKKVPDQGVEKIIKDPMKIYGVVPGSNGVNIIGCHLDKCSDIKLIDSKIMEMDKDELDQDIFIDNVELKYNIQNDVINLEISNHVDLTGCSIFLCAEEYSCIVKDALAWKEYIKTLSKQ